MSHVAVLTSQDGRQVWHVLSTSATAGQAASALRLLSACVASGGAPARAVLAEFQFRSQQTAAGGVGEESDGRLGCTGGVRDVCAGVPRRHGPPADSGEERGGEDEARRKAK